MDELSTEKQTMMGKYERELVALRQLHEQREAEMKGEHEARMLALQQQHSTERHTDATRHTEQLATLRQVRIKIQLRILVTTGLVRSHVSSA